MNVQRWKKFLYALCLYLCIGVSLCCACVSSMWGAKSTTQGCQMRCTKNIHFSNAFCWQTIRFLLQFFIFPWFFNKFTILLSSLFLFSNVYFFWFHINHAITLTTLLTGYCQMCATFVAISFATRCKNELGALQLLLRCLEYQLDV